MATYKEAQFIRSAMKRQAERMAVITSVISWIPDLLIAWLWMKFVNGGLTDFGTALLVIYGIELFLSTKRVLAGSLAFHLYGKRGIVRFAHAFWSLNEFPLALEHQATREGYQEYLERLVEDIASPAALKESAKAELAAYHRAYASGFWSGLRVQSAYDAAIASYRG